MFVPSRAPAFACAVFGGLFGCPDQSPNPDTIRAHAEALIGLVIVALEAMHHKKQRNTYAKH